MNKKYYKTIDLLRVIKNTFTIGTKDSFVLPNSEEVENGLSVPASLIFDDFMKYQRLVYGNDNFSINISEYDPELPSGYIVFKYTIYDGRSKKYNEDVINTIKTIDEKVQESKIKCYTNKYKINSNNNSIPCYIWADKNTGVVRAYYFLIKPSEACIGYDENNDIRLDFEYELKNNKNPIIGASVDTFMNYVDYYSSCNDCLGEYEYVKYYDKETEESIIIKEVREDFYEKRTEFAKNRHIYAYNKPKDKNYLRDALVTEVTSDFAPEIIGDEEDQSYNPSDKFKSKNSRIIPVDRNNDIPLEDRITFQVLADDDFTLDSIIYTAKVTPLYNDDCIKYFFDPKNNRYDVYISKDILGVAYIDSSVSGKLKTVEDKSTIDKRLYSDFVNGYAGDNFIVITPGKPDPRKGETWKEKVRAGIPIQLNKPIKAKDIVRADNEFGDMSDVFRICVAHFLMAENPGVTQRVGLVDIRYLVKSLALSKNDLKELYNDGVFSEDYINSLVSQGFLRKDDATFVLTQ